MFGGSSDDDSRFSLVSSQPEYDKVPNETVFKFKTSTRKFAYKLHQGVELPYSTQVAGNQICV